MNKKIYEEAYLALCHHGGYWIYGVYDYVVYTARFGQSLLRPEFARLDIQ